MASIARPVDFMIVTECRWANPNGDPDADGAPRTDPETGIGLVTAGCTNRKIRDYVIEKTAAGELPKQGDHAFDVLIRRNEIGSLQEEAIDAACGDHDKTTVTKAKKKDPDVVNKVKRILCDRYWDVRAFGQVCNALANAGIPGQITGAVHMDMGTSVEPVHVQDIGITRMAAANAKEMEQKGPQTMGEDHRIPFGLYVQTGHIDVPSANWTGFDQADEELLFEAIANMYSSRHTFMRGEVNLVHLFVFEHDSKNRNVSPRKLFDAIHIDRKADVEFPRSVSDYDVFVDEDAIPDTVTLKDLAK